MSKEIPEMFKKECFQLGPKAMRSWREMNGILRPGISSSPFHFMLQQPAYSPLPDLDS